MKKGSVLHPQLSQVIASMGHTDQLVVGDAGLPIPEHVERVDLALTKNVPTFLQTLEVILSELEVESAVVATEIQEKNPEVLSAIKKALPKLEIEFVPHETFKEITSDAKAVVRTGECSPYANIILRSGVTF